jgi:hypothetical protein
MTNPKPRATASIDVISRGKASILISSLDGTFESVGGWILREGKQRYRVENDDGELVTHVQQYRRAARPLAEHYGILPAHTLKTDVEHEQDSHLPA